jgi:filamentous hemagglutinin family protein
MLFAVASQAHATVNGGKVAAGAAAITTNGTTTTINQSTDRAVINWNSFDIGANEKVQINQPASTSAVLNRVNSATGTRIDGELTASGRVFVVNPNGVVVGESGKINANGVVLSTLDVSDANFMESPNNQYGSTLSFRRLASASEASVVNDGAITAAEGGISLFGNQVINNGTLRAAGDQGGDIFGPSRGKAYVNTINLVAADAIDAMQNYDSGEYYGGYVYTGLLVPNAAPVVAASPSANNLVVNSGAIELTGGQVKLQAASPASSGDAAVVRNTGSILLNDYSQWDFGYLSSVELSVVDPATGQYKGGLVDEGLIEAPYIWSW